MHHIHIQHDDIQHDDVFIYLFIYSFIYLVLALLYIHYLSAGERFSLVWFTPLGVQIPEDLFWIDPATGQVKE
jgi:hypothetical protein